ncbi:MAG TPA: hypothetical protein DDZ51_11805 [Planctomycetaceae bacterium]|nr:hypothetical protein [Planctomycetaceae bacterium]
MSSHPLSNCAHLADRFDHLSKTFPRLSLIVALKPSDVRLVEHELGLYDSPMPIVHGRYEPQHLCDPSMVRDVFEDEERWTYGPWRYPTPEELLNPSGFAGEHELPDVQLMFPFWYASRRHEDSNVWAMWLYRNYGRDPQSSSALPDPTEQLKCLNSYMGICEEAGRFLKQQIESIQLPAWFADTCEAMFCTSCDELDGYRGMPTYWMLFLALYSRFESSSSYPPKGSEAVEPIKLRVIKDIGLESYRILRHIARTVPKNNHVTDAVPKKTVKNARIDSKPSGDFSVTGLVSRSDQNVKPDPSPVSHIASNGDFLAALREPLTPNDRFILAAMKELGAVSAANPVASERILFKAGVISSGTVWNNLIKNDLVESKRSVGRWLSEGGNRIADRLDLTSG